MISFTHMCERSVQRKGRNLILWSFQVSNYDLSRTTFALIFYLKYPSILKKIEPILSKNLENILFYSKVENSFLFFFVTCSKDIIYRIQHLKTIKHKYLPHSSGFLPEQICVSLPDPTDLLHFQIWKTTANFEKRANFVEKSAH